MTGLGSAEPLIFLRSRKIPPRPARCPPTPERAVLAGCAAHRSDGTGTGTGTRRGTGTGMGAGTGTGIGLLWLCAVLLALPGAWGERGWGCRGSGAGGGGLQVRALLGLPPAISPSLPR